MKKLAMLAVVALAALTAQAQEVFKQVSGIKDYAEAYKLVQAKAPGLSAEERAKCYNAVVDLAMKKVEKENGIILNNQMAEQLRSKIEPFDTVGLYDAMRTALICGKLCDEADQQPNEKGKIAPKFHKKNAERLYARRFHLINAVMYYQAKSDDITLDFLGTYTESSAYPLFAEQDKSQDDQLGQMAFFAARYAYIAKKYDQADKYCDIAMQDPQYASDAMNIKLLGMQEQLKTRNDSITYVDKLKAMYAADESNETIFGIICSMLTAMNETQALDAFVDAKLAKDPQNFTALAMKGQASLDAQKWDDAISYLQKAANVQPQNAAAPGLIGYSYMAKAKDMAETAGNKMTDAQEKEILGVYDQAITWLEKARDLDTDRQFKSIWAYPLYNCCYIVYGEDHAKTKAAEGNVR